MAQWLFRSDAYVVKLNTSDGSMVWVEQQGGIGSDFGRGIAVDGFGNVYATGGFRRSVTLDPPLWTWDLGHLGSDASVC